MGVEKILKKLQDGTALSPQEAADAAAYFYPKLHSGRAADMTAIQTYLGQPFTPKGYGPGKAVAIFEEYSPEQLGSFFEKYHFLSGHAAILDTPNKQSEITDLVQQDPELESYILTHAPTIPATATYDQLRQSLINLEHNYLQGEQKQIDAMAEPPAPETAKKLVHDAVTIGWHGVADPARGLHFSEAQVLTLLKNYPALATLSATENKELNQFFLTYVTFPREAYDFKRSVVDKTLADMMSGSDLPPSLSSLADGGGLQNILAHFDGLSDAQKIDYLQYITGKYCAQARIPTTLVRMDNTIPGQGEYDGTIRINMDKINTYYQESLIPPADQPLMCHVQLMNTLFHELDHHMNAMWQKEVGEFPVYPNRSGFKYRTVTLLNATQDYDDHALETHDYRPLEKMANLIGDGYVAPRILAIAAPDKATRLQSFIDIDAKNSDVQKDVQQEYIQEFNASGLNALPSPVTPATNSNSPSKIITK